MTTQAAFLADILENADDDAPRLIYADWLDDQGRPELTDRAEFIRVQCRLARLPIDDPERPALVERERGLLQTYLLPWLQELPEVRSVSWAGFQRGFPAHIHVSGYHWFARHAPVLFATAPIQAVEFTAGHHAYLDLTTSPYLARLRWLKLSNRYLDAGGGQAIAASAHVAGLRTLVISNRGINLGGAVAILNSTQLAALEHLELRNNLFGNGAARTIATTTGLPRLVRLDLRHNAISDRGAALLTASPLFDRLHCLDLRDNYLLSSDCRRALCAHFGERVRV